MFVRKVRSTLLGRYLGEFFGHVLLGRIVDEDIQAPKGGIADIAGKRDAATDKPPPRPFSDWPIAGKMDQKRMHVHVFYRSERRSSSRLPARRQASSPDAICSSVMLYFRRQFGCSMEVAGTLT